MKVLKGKIPGGYEFKQFKGQPSPELVISELPEYLLVSIDESKTKVKPFVRSGDKVRTGQIIWQDDSIISSPKLSPVDGVVESIERKGPPESPVSLVRIAPGAVANWENVPGFTADWRKLDKSELDKVIYLSGTASLGSGGIPTEFNSSVIKPEEVQHIIIHSTDAEVYNPDISLFLQDDGAKHFAEGLSILSKIMDKSDIHIAISRNTSTWFQVIDNAITDVLPVTYHKVKAKYPQNHDTVLIKTVLGEDLPAGYKGVNKGVVVLTIQDVCQVYEAVVLGKPLIDRIVALAGEAFTNRAHVKLKLGTTVSAVSSGRLIFSDPEDIRFVRNSVLTGAVLDSDSPITADMDVLIALKEKRTQPLLPFAMPGFRADSFSNTFFAKFIHLKKDADTNIRGEERGCLACGFCQDVCPVGILPNILYPYVERDRLDETPIQYGIFRCIDCNLCTYVCTSKIPIAYWLKEGKKRLLEDGFLDEESFISTFDLIGIKTGEEQLNETAE